MKDWIVITGPTASGKTRLAVQVAFEISGEIISIDSRQVFRRMDIGTGKDLNEYRSFNVNVHLIDILDPGDEYHVAAFQEDFDQVIRTIEEQNKTPVLCGGTGLYLESVLSKHRYTKVPVDPELRDTLEKYETSRLIRMLEERPPLPFQVDTHSRKRLIRALEIQEYLKDHRVNETSQENRSASIFILDLPREERRRRISKRLFKRLNEGMIEEVIQLRESISDEILIRYGLEYKYITLHLQGNISYDQMTSKLETEIHRYAKRQMTWFRRLARQREVTWLNAMDPIDKLKELILGL
jgi:tRNA dimethylallyltransferase